MSTDPSRKEILANLRARGFRASPRRGQNFLFDRQLLDAFLDDAGVESEELVLEVGPGPGTLSRRLLARGCRVVAVELDSLLAGFLRDSLPELRVLEEDALSGKNQLGAGICSEFDGAGPFRLIANLPYSIATSLIQLLIARFPEFRGFGCLVQREVAERWVASVNTAEYAAISVLLDLSGTGRLTRHVGRQLFAPPPRVDSSFVVWDRNDRQFPELAGAHDWARTVFQQRRKMIRSTLSEWLPAADPWWQRGGLDPTSRPQEIRSAQYLDLAAELDRRGAQPPRGAVEDQP